MTGRPALTLFCAIALRGAAENTLLPAFTRDTGITVEARFAPTSALVRDIDAGARSRPRSSTTPPSPQQPHHTPPNTTPPRSWPTWPGNRRRPPTTTPGSSPPAEGLRSGL